MGKLNVLKANWTGSVGNTTGVVQHGKSVIKAKIWSKAPASPVQKSSVRAFEALNRVCGILARRWAKWLPVKKGNMLLHNALAKYFSAVVANHTFDVAGFRERVTGDAKIAVTNFDFDSSTGSLRFTATAQLADFESGHESWVIVVTDAGGRILHFAQPAGTVYNYNATVSAIDPSIIYVLCFSASNISGKNVLTGFTGGVSVFNGVWFPLMTGAVQRAYVQGNTLYIEAPSAYYADGKITFPEQ